MTMPPLPEFPGIPGLPPITGTGTDTATGTDADTGTGTGTGTGITQDPATATDAAPPPADRRRHSWWRRNLPALLAVVVLLPATVVAIGGQEWHEYYGFGARPVSPLVVEPDATAELAGATWGPVRSAELDDLEGFDVPTGARVIGVAIPVDVGAEGISCRPPTLTQQSSGRSWTPVHEEIGLSYDPDEPDSCTTDRTGDYELIVPFVLPDDVDGPFWVDVWPPDADGAFVRFSVDP